MPSALAAGPYRVLNSPEGQSFPYYIVPFDERGSCEGPKTRKHLLENLAGVSDVFVFSHGWNNDWSTATARYESFIQGFQRLRSERNLKLPEPYAPLLVGIFWPSQSLAWFDSETGPGFAAANPAEQDAAAHELHVALREVAGELPVEKRERFHELAQSEALAPGEDRELAELFALALAGSADTEAGAAPAPSAADLLAAARALEAPEPDFDAVGTAGPAAPSSGPAAAGFGDVLAKLDPRNLVKPFTVWKMKDRAGRVGAKGVAPLLADLLRKSDPEARIHLIGHSFGCKVVMTAACAMPEPARPLESALLLQAAVSQYCFASKVPEHNVPGGFVKALARVKRPIMATFSRHDNALTKTFHLAVRRHDDLGELQFAGAGTPSRYGALGGFGPQGTQAAIVPIAKPGQAYDLSGGARVVGLESSSAIGGHGDVSNPATWWAQYCLLSAHQN